MTARVKETTGLFGDVFEGFGPSRFLPQGETPSRFGIRSRSVKVMLHRVKRRAPRLAGVYGMLDAKGRIIYVGKAKNLRARLLSYFRVNSRNPKAGKILSRTRTLVWERTPDEFSALLRELELIRRFRPRFNVVGQPGPRRLVWLCLGNGPAAHVHITREPTKRDLVVYGPLFGRASLDESVRRVNEWFKLRDCPSTIPMFFVDQPELFAQERAAKCLRYELGTCLGPCASGCTRKDYAVGVRGAKAFLDGRNRTPIDELQKRMQEASNALQFEKAASLRDRLRALSWLDDRLTLLRDARRGGSMLYSLEGPEGTVCYLIRGGDVRAAFREPRDDSEAAAMQQEIAKLISEPAGADVDRSVDSVLLVAAWFRKNEGEKAKLRKWDTGKKGESY